MEIKKTATIKVIIILLLSLFCLPPNIMSQPSKKGAVKVLIGKNPVGSAIRKGETGKTTPTAAQRYGSGITNTNVSQIPSAQTARVPLKRVGIKDAIKHITPSRLPDINVPIAPINKNKVIEYKPLSSEWDKEWIDLIDYEIERVYKLKIRSTENKTVFVYINHSRYDKDFQLSA